MKCILTKNFIFLTGDVLVSWFIVKFVGSYWDNWFNVCCNFVASKLQNTIHSWRLRLGWDFSIVEMFQILSIYFTLFSINLKILVDGWMLICIGRKLILCFIITSLNSRHVQIQPLKCFFRRVSVSKTQNMWFNEIWVIWCM